MQEVLQLNSKISQQTFVWVFPYFILIKKSKSRECEWVDGIE